MEFPEWATNGRRVFQSSMLPDFSVSYDEVVMLSEIAPVFDARFIADALVDLLCRCKY